MTTPIIFPCINLKITGCRFNAKIYLNLSTSTRKNSFWSAFDSGNTLSVIKLIWIIFLGERLMSEHSICWFYNSYKCSHYKTLTSDKFTRHLRLLNCQSFVNSFIIPFFIKKDYKLGAWLIKSPKSLDKQRFWSRVAQNL